MLSAVLEDDSVPVSIHASAREATSFRTSITSKAPVSIHASAREATEFLRQIERKRQVSIHASAREATSVGAARYP